MSRAETASVTHIILACFVGFSNLSQNMKIVLLLIDLQGQVKFLDS